MCFRRIHSYFIKFYYGTLFWIRFNWTLRKQNKKEKIIRNHLFQKFGDAGLPTALQKKLVQIYIQNSRSILDKKLVQRARQPQIFTVQMTP
ncbi:MAG: hypothetical protein ACTSYD_09735 [Candidatus Heimdallarchaeaceae archaeon]